jgi:putative transposase
MAVHVKGAHVPQAIMRMGMRWYVAYALSYRHGEALLADRGVAVDDATL